MRMDAGTADTVDPSLLLNVITAVKKGDFSVRMPLDQTGIAGRIADGLNDVIEMNEKLVAELARIGRVVGKEGKTTQRATIGHTGGSWSGCIESVNTLIVDLVQPTTEVARVIGAVANGDLSQTMALDIDGQPLTGEFLLTAKTVNTMVNQLGAFASEVTRVAREAGTDGKLGGQASVPGAAGTWRDLTDNVNRLATTLTTQIRAIAEVATAVTTGDLSRSITVETAGEVASLKDNINEMIRNLLSNSFKFTEQGHVNLDMKPVTEGWSRQVESLNRAGAVIAFSVSDTGIGIPVHRQKMVFEAFQQGDGTTSRKYGGTGLGLSISREIASLLGGEIRLVSTPGEGSTFTLYIPQSFVPAPPRRSAVEMSPPPAPSRGDNGSRGGGGGGAARMSAPDILPPTQSAPLPEIPIGVEVNDDRNSIETGDQTILIIEDDPVFAGILLDLAREKGFKGIVATSGEAGSVLVRRYQPSAITLDIRLPDVDGWTVLDRLKHDPATRHIPIRIISAPEEPMRGLRQGAIAQLQKPVSREAIDQALADIKGFLDRKVRRLLLVEDDAVQRSSIVELIGNGDVETAAVSTGAEALAALKADRYDCRVLDLGLPDMTGFELIEKIRKEEGLVDLPIVIYTGKDLTRKQETELRRLADTIIVKDAKSPERLLDETTLFLHRVQSSLPSSQKQMLEQARLADPVLAGKKVLVVDDDVRNIFALTSLLEQRHMQVLFTENGRDAIELLRNEEKIDVVLMDIMMPEMDGFETMRSIRKIGKFKSLPIIALTAKAMKGDRDTCIEAGASDYISKLVDTEQLLSLLRVWLYK